MGNAGPLPGDAVVAVLDVLAMIVRPLTPEEREKVRAAHPVGYYPPGGSWQFVAAGVTVSGDVVFGFGSIARYACWDCRFKGGG